MRRQTVIVATRSVRSPAYCFTLPFAHQALMPINVVATAGSNRYADDHGHCMASRCIVPKHIPVTWWPKTDSVSPQLGWLEKATDDAPAEPPRAACRLAPARPFEYPGRRDIDPVQPGANPRNVQTPQSHPAQSTPTTTSTPPGKPRRQSTALRLGRHARARPRGSSAAHPSPHRRHARVGPMAHLLGAEAVHLAYPTQVVFEAVTLGVNDGARIGIVGRNGDGKSSLLGLLTGQLRPDSGRVTRRSGLRVNALSQTDTLDPNRTVGWTLIGDQPEHQWAGNPRIRDVVAGLVSDIAWDTPVSTLSGGQRRRVQLASLLVGEWDVIALDEPTNHLDIQGITGSPTTYGGAGPAIPAAYSWSPTTAGSSTRSPPQHGKCTTESSNLSKAATRRTCCSASSGTG